MINSRPSAPPRTQRLGVESYVSNTQRRAEYDETRRIETTTTRVCKIGLVILLTLAPGADSSITAQQSKPTAHFHHIHLNTLDPPAAIKFYTTKFDCEQRQFFDQGAVWAQQSWFLFNKVKTAPAWELTSAIWHFGWGAEDMKATYQKQLELGTKFFTPLTDISDILGGNATGRFFYSYVETPDHGLVELNTANHHRFGHLHLFSEDPVAASQWYEKHFGVTVRNISRDVRIYRDQQVGPSASLMMDNVNIIIYPIEYSKKAYTNQWRNSQTKMSSTKGRVVDHIAFEVADLEVKLAELSAAGVKTIERTKTDYGGKFKHAFIEGPDSILIELVDFGVRRPGVALL